MQNSNESKCYFVQLQIDSFLDGDLAQAQQDSFMSHIQSCESCAKELHFARNLHDRLMDLPLLDCPDSVLEPIHRLSEVADSQSRPTVWAGFIEQLLSLPLTVRIAVPAFALVLLSLSFNLEQNSPMGNSPQVASGEIENFSPEEIQQALTDLNLAIDYLNDVSQRTEVMIGERFIVNPLQDSINASFDRARDRSQTRQLRSSRLQNDPI